MLIAASPAGAESVDPTRPALYTPVAGGAGSAPDDSGWNLTSLLVSVERRSAVINGFAVTEGDEINGARVTEIAPRGVKLRRGGETIFLRLWPGGINKKDAGKVAKQP